jgi:dUTP diphosphatase
VAAKVGFAWLEHGRGLSPPAAATSGAAGFDLGAAVAAEVPVMIEPGGRVLVPTGLTLALPAGFEGQVRPRSGMAAEHGVTVLNAPGTIDADYRGEIKVILVNLGKQPFEVRRGDRIAQLVIARVAEVEFVETPALDRTGRGAAGFGSTGMAGDVEWPTPDGS